jgi:hypothetical protein
MGGKGQSVYVCSANFDIIELSQYRRYLQTVKAGSHRVSESDLAI